MPGNIGPLKLTEPAFYRTQGEVVKNKFIDVVKSLSRSTAWAHTRARDLRAAARRAWTWMSRTGKGPYRFVREFAWGHLFTVIGHLVRAILLFLTALGVLIAAVTFVVQLEDRQGEQTYRAWQVVREYENRQGASGAPLRDALQFINREFGGALCWAPVNRFPQWLTGNPRQCLFPRKNRESLAKLQARQVDLAGIDLARADLTGADLTGADLTDATLTGATLRNVSLIRAELVRADLAGADLTGAKLRASEFTFRGRDAITEHGLVFPFTPADFSEALGNGDLTCADLSEVLMEDFRGAGTDLTGADLTGADLTGADLLSANFTGANLTRAKLDRAHLCCVDFTDANLTGANWSGAACSDAMLQAGSLVR